MCKHLLDGVLINYVNFHVIPIHKDENKVHVILAFDCYFEVVNEYRVVIHHE